MREMIEAYENPVASSGSAAREAKPFQVVVIPKAPYSCQSLVNSSVDLFTRTERFSLGNPNFNLSERIP